MVKSKKPRNPFQAKVFGAFVKPSLTTLVYSKLLNTVYFSISDKLCAYNLETKSVEEIGTHFQINSLSISEDSTILITSSNKSKSFKIWKKNSDNNNFTETKEVTTQKKILSSILTKDCKSIILTDKNGDVFLYHLDGSNNNLKEEEGEEKNLLLGHFSAITDTKFSPCKKFILTSDRDEKIRVSKYPNTFDINNFCLGHTQFVSQFIFSPKNPEILVSGSGDGTIKVWKWESGELLQSLDFKTEGQKNVDDSISIPLAFSNDNTVYISVEGRSKLYTYKFNETTNKLESENIIDLEGNEPLSFPLLVANDSKLLIPFYTKETTTPIFLTLDTATNKIDTEFADAINKVEPGKTELQDLNRLLKVQYKKYLTLNDKRKPATGEQQAGDEQVEEEGDSQDEGEEAEENEENEKAVKLRKTDNSKQQTK